MSAVLFCVYYALVTAGLVYLCTRPNCCDLCGRRILSSHRAVDHEFVVACLFCDPEGGHV